jgi:hypothetical protein
LKADLRKAFWLFFPKFFSAVAKNCPNAPDRQECLPHLSLELDGLCWGRHSCLLNTSTGCDGFSPSRIVGVATQTIQRCVERMNRVYEQRADAVRIGDYVRRWWTWVRSGLAEDVALRRFVNTPHPVQSPFVVVDQGRSPSIAKHPVPSGIVLGGFGYSVWF